MLWWKRGRRRASISAELVTMWSEGWLGRRPVLKPSLKVDAFAYGSSTAERGPRRSIHTGN
jgi:hypothetical protein